jgi:hypothetical protein
MSPATNGFVPTLLTAASAASKENQYLTDVVGDRRAGLGYHQQANSYTRRTAAGEKFNMLRQEAAQPSRLILVFASARSVQSHVRTRNMSADDRDLGVNGESASELLSTKWLSPLQLAALAEEKGVVYKKGRFSPLECGRVKAAVESYKTVRFHFLRSRMLVDQA